MDDTKSLGRYSVTGMLGRGAMGVVYRGVDPRIGREVAIKLVRNDAPEDLAEEVRMRFELEFQAAGRLSHPNIVTVYDAGSEGDDLYFVMDLVGGGSLGQRLASESPLPPAEAVQIAMQVASALDYAHSQGFVHRDIKPANILIDADGRPKVADFGIAKFQGVDNTRTGGILGTPAYMSPEQADGTELSGASDQFSLAVIVYEMLAGARPFGGTRPSQILMAILKASPKLPTELNPSLPPGTNQVMLRALAKEPSERYPTCKQFIVALESTFRDDMPTTVAMPGQPAAPEQPSPATPIEPVPPPLVPAPEDDSPSLGHSDPDRAFDLDIRPVGVGAERRPRKRGDQAFNLISGAIVLAVLAAIGTRYFILTQEPPAEAAAVGGEPETETGSEADSPGRPVDGSSDAEQEGEAATAVLSPAAEPAVEGVRG